MEINLNRKDNYNKMDVSKRREELQYLSVKNGLKPLAKSLGIKKYYAMNKNELIEKILLNGKSDVNILDEPVPEINVPILKSKPATSIIKSLKIQARKAYEKTQEKIIDFGNWITSYVPKPFVKKVDERVESLKKKIKRIYENKPRKIIKLTESALNENVKTFHINLGNSVDPLTQLKSIRKERKDLLEKELKKLRNLKFIEGLQITFYKELEIRDIIIPERKQAFFNSNPKTITNESQIEELLKENEENIPNQIQTWISDGSDWIIESVDDYELNIVKYKPLRGSAYVELPKILQNSKKGLVNLKNNDNECFRWCHIRHLNPQDKDPQRIKNVDKEFIKKLDYSGIKFPVKKNQYVKIEKQNKININVFGYENGQKFPIHISKELNENVLNLLLIKEHYVLIKDFDRFMFSYSKHKEKKHFCMHCLQSFSKEKFLKEHKEICIEVNGKQGIRMPKEGSILNFKNYYKQLAVPFVIYADFEALTIKNDGPEYQKHKDCSFGYKVICCYDDSLSKLTVIYRGENAVYKFLEEMLKERKYCREMKEKHFSNLEDDNFKIPVIFHNLKGYDSHFIMQNIGKIVKNHKNGKEMKINCIPNNMEKYMSFSLGKDLVFIDSFQFMSSSLENLVKNLPKESFKYTSEEFKENTDLVKQKGIYPYDYMNKFEKFREIQLPLKEDFYSILNDENVSDESYEHAQNIWKEFKLQNMGEYHDLYLKTDILLLADVFENFRKTCLKYYELDPCHYFTSPGLSWDAMLKMTNVNLELISDIDMYQFIEKGTRGGVSYIANRYSKANNKYMKNFNENEDSKYIMYLDANNLYGWAMSQDLPTGNFKWVEDVNNINLQNGKGLIYEVDLEYPPELHDLHNDYPLAPEKMKIKEEMLSNYSKTIQEKFDISTGRIQKLVTNLSDKTKYILHYKNLQLYLNLGMKLKKIHRVLEFDQSPWLKEYIDFNTEKRKNAKNDFEKDFFKLMNNSVFGKTMENLRKRVDVKLVTNEKELEKLVSKPTYKSHKIFNEELVAIHKIKESLHLNRPSYVGMCILDLSKTLMYDFHYNYIKEKYDSKLLFTDTDSLTYEIKSEDIYKDFWKDKSLFDNSSSIRFQDNTNKKVIGKFKDEAAGIPITEFVGLRSKMYSYTKDNNTDARTAKGIKKNTIKKQIKHNDYRETLFENKQMSHSMNIIKSVKHQIGSYNLRKISLSCFDDKRYIHDNGIDSYAYGHWRIK